MISIHKNVILHVVNNVHVYTCVMVCIWLMDNIGCGTKNLVFFTKGKPFHYNYACVIYMLRKLCHSRGTWYMWHVYNRKRINIEQLNVTWWKCGSQPAWKIPESALQCRCLALTWTPPVLTCTPGTSSFRSLLYTYIYVILLCIKI